MKKGIRYLRFSSIGQSKGSIEWQDMYTKPWFESNGVELIDTYIDRGFSARTFDRPDMNELTAFIRKYHRTVDYLVVCELDRFSRDAGEAMTLVKKLQLKYSVHIVSVTEGIVFDYHDPGSFFRTGLSLLLAEDDNIRRTNKIHNGIYTAKAKEGRYIGSHAPYGYKKEGDGKDKHLVIDEEQAAVIRYVYDAFVRGVPEYIIKEEAVKRGMPCKGNSAIEKVLVNPIYSGQQWVKSHRGLPGGLFKGLHQPIIDVVQWQQVQQLKNKKPQVKSIVSDDMPLRGVLMCHCGKLLTGAASTGRHGGQFFYYKCHGHKHNISAITAHQQLLEAFGYMSLPQYLVTALQEQGEALLDVRMKAQQKDLQKKRNELEDTETKLHSVEEKWISNQMQWDTYQRWFNDLSQKRTGLQATIDNLSSNVDEVYGLLRENLHYCTDLPYVYTSATTLQKQELIRLVFDSRLYYQSGMYRTPYILPVFSHNNNILNDKQLLVVDKKGENQVIFPLGGAEGNAVEPLTAFLRFVRSLRVA